MLRSKPADPHPGIKSLVIVVVVEVVVIVDEEDVDVVGVVLPSGMQTERNSVVFGKDPWEE